MHERVIFDVNTLEFILDVAHWDAGLLTIEPHDGSVHHQTMHVFWLNIVLVPLNVHFAV